MKPTRREWIALGIFAVLFILGMTVEQSALDRWEWLLIPLVIFFAWLINTDPQRINNGG